MLCCGLLGCQPNVDAVLPPLDEAGPNVAGSSYAATVQRTPGLFAYFRFSEPGGLVAVDRIGGHRLSAEEAASLGGMGAIAADPEKGAASFDASVASRFTMPFPVAFEEYGRALSLELWLKLRGIGAGCEQPSTPFAKLIWVDGALGGGAWGLGLTGPEQDALGFQLQVDVEAYQLVNAVTLDGVLQKPSGASCADAAWQHVVATFDAAAITGQMKIYVDGQLTANNPGLHPVTLEGDAPLAIAGFEVDASLDVGGSGLNVNDDNGVATLGEPFDGSIDELALYSRALTASEVSGHFAAGLP